MKLLNDNSRITEKVIEEQPNEHDSTLVRKATNV
jgi:hypothetical protein